MTKILIYMSKNQEKMKKMKINHRSLHSISILEQIKAK